MNEVMESLSQPLSQLTHSAVAHDFLELTPRKTIEELKDRKKEASYLVLATIKHVVDNEDWCYTACMCNKAVYPDSNRYFCEKCKRHVMKVCPRYRIKVKVIDDTDYTTFVIFDQEAAIMLNKSCVEMYEIQEKNGVVGSTPKEIKDLVDKTFIFKVNLRNASSSKFEQSFHVKKICSDGEIIKKFKDLSRSAMDLLAKFSTSINETESQTKDKDGTKLPKGLEELTPLDNFDTAKVNQSDIKLSESNDKFDCD